MPHDARAIANFCIETAQYEGVSLTHLALQKIIFFAHGWHLARFSEPLIGQKFEAWRYGPVVRVIYDQLKHLKSQPIDKLLRVISIETGEWVIAQAAIEAERRAFIVDVTRYYSRFHAGKLVDLTHVAGGPWEKIWNRAVDNVVPGVHLENEDIRSWILREGGSEGLIAH